MNYYKIIVALFVAIAALAGIGASAEISCALSGQWQGQLEYGQFTALDDIAYDGAGTLYVTDTAEHRITAISGQHVWRVFGTEGSGAAEFRSPRGIAVGPDGRIYVVDTGNRRVQVLTNDGVFKSAWTTGECDDIAFDRGGAIYLTDVGRDRVVKYAASGVLLAAWGTTGDGPGQFRDPSGIAVDRRTDAVYVADSERNCVKVFTNRGRFIRQWGTRGSGNGQFESPKDIAVAPDGTVWVADQGNARLQRFTPAGIWLGRIDLASGQPEGIAIAPNGTVGVCELQEEAVEVYAPDGRQVDRFGARYDPVPPMFSQPKALVSDGKGAVYVVDAALSTLQKVSRADGRLVWGTEPGEYFAAATGVTVGQGGTVYAASFHDGGVKMFTKDGRYIGSFGSEICGGSPHIADLASAPNGDIYAFACERIFRFDRNGRLITSWGDLEPGTVGGLAVSQDVTVHLGDMTFRRIRRFTPSGEPLAPIDLSATVGELGWFTFDKTGRLFVVDTSVPRVVILDKKGAVVSSFITPIVGPMTVDHDGTVFIVSWTEHVLMQFTPGAGPTLTPTATATPMSTSTPSGAASFTAAPLTAPKGSAVKFTVTPASGKTVREAWWSFDAPAHLNTWNSGTINPTFYYFVPGTYSPLVRLTYTDGTTEEVHRVNYIRAT